MTVAVVDGDPLPPPEHMYHATCAFDIIWDEEESKHHDAPFSVTPKPPGTKRYGGNTVAQSNGRRNSDNEPLPLPHPRPHPRLETARDNSNTPPLPSIHISTTKNTKNTKNIKTNDAKTSNGQTYIDHEQTTTK